MIYRAIRASKHDQAQIGGIRILASIDYNNNRNTLLIVALGIGF